MGKRLMKIQRAEDEEPAPRNLAWPKVKETVVTMLQGEVHATRQCQVEQCTGPLDFVFLSWLKVRRRIRIAPLET